MEQLISLILKVAKEQGYCFPGNKVMIFTVENEGKVNETAAFRMIDIDEEWSRQYTKPGNLNYYSNIPRLPLKMLIHELLSAIFALPLLLFQNM